MMSTPEILCQVSDLQELFTLLEIYDKISLIHQKKIHSKNTYREDWLGDAQKEIQGNNTIIVERPMPMLEIEYQRITEKTVGYGAGTTKSFLIHMSINVNC